MSDRIAERRAADAEGRRLAQQEFRRPVAIEAGAGTGKTATLVARVLSWCLAPGWERAREADPEASEKRIAERVLRGVVAITFTEAAAAEMESRIDRALAELAQGRTPVGFGGDAPEERIEVQPVRVAALRGALDQLVVQTIHAYCRRLLAAHPLEAGLHPLFEIDADGSATEVAVREAIVGTLRDAGENEDTIALAAEGVGPREIELELALQLGAGMRAADWAGDPLAAERVAALGQRLDAAHAALAAATGDLDALGGAARSVGESLVAGRAALAAPLRDGSALVGLREDFAGIWPSRSKDALERWSRGKFSKGQLEWFAGRADEVAAAAGPLYKSIKHLERIDPPALARLAPLLARLAADTEERLRRRGRVGFEGLLARSAALLEERPQVAAALRQGIDQLLVDELQDTDPAQCAIVAALALEGPPEARPGLFLVGDPKQSIYGWRNADLAAYEGLLERVRAADGVVGTLCVNHRSRPAILDEVERVIAPVMQREPGYQPAFEVLVPSPQNEDLADASVEYWIPAPRDPDGALQPARSREAALLEARALARDLRERHDRDDLAWRDVGVLFRSRGDWDVYLGALREAGVPFRVEGDRTYYRRREIVDAAAAVCCVLDPNDLLSLVTLLRSVVAGVPDAAWIPLWEGGLPALAARLGDEARVPDELAALLAKVESECAERVPGLGRLRGWSDAARVCLESVAALRRCFARDPGDVFVERLRAAFCLEAGEAARFLGAWRTANLERFFTDLAAELASGVSPAVVMRRLRRAVAEEEPSSAEPASREDDEAVDIVTLHGAKGLDWEHVYLMQLHKGGARGGQAARGLRIDGEVEGSWCARPTLAADRADERRERVAAAERVRTLYVGMTRARRRLVVSGLWRELQQRRAPESLAALLESREPAASPLELAREAASQAGRVRAAEVEWVFPALWPPEASLAPRPVAAPRSEFAASPERGAELPPASRAERPAGVSISELASEPAPASSERERPTAAPSTVGRAVGSALHAAFEALELDVDPERAWSRQRARVEGSARRAAAASEREAAAAQALELWDALGRGALGRRLHDLGDRVIARELPLLLSDPEREGSPAAAFGSGAIDLLYRDADGELVVVDYKSDAPEAADADERRRRHRRQGALYCRAVAEALGAAPRFEIWWLRSGAVERWDTHEIRA